MIRNLDKLSFFYLFWSFFHSISQAQVVPDNTLLQNSTVNSDCTSSCQIDDGTTRGSNLFHSFEEFSVPPNGEVIFNHNSSIENIFTRVTGSSMSKIDGTISTQIKDDIGNQGSANLFLINPQGIMFGDNARLNIGGSFLATTADSIFFGNDRPFSARNPSSSPLLTVSVPIGLQFGETPGEIVNQSQVKGDPPPFPLSLVVPPDIIGIKVNNGKTIALVASGIILDEGLLTAWEGRVELGSVAANSFVDLSKNNEEIILSYDSVNQFEKIAIIDAQIKTGTEVKISHDGSPNLPSGNIQINGGIIELNDSQISSINDSNLVGGSITINADTFTLIDSFITTQTTGNGQGGNLNINATTIDLIRSNAFSEDETVGLFAQTGDLFSSFSGQAGNVKIETNRLTVRNGAQISVTTAGKGESGNLIVNASESTEVIGRSVNGGVVSGLFAQSTGGDATGDAGNLQINTKKLIVRDGGRISVGAIEDTNTISQGNGGRLSINASESIEVTGFGENEQGEIAPSTLLSESQGIGNAGDLEINTPKLIVSNQGEINVSATGTGQAGSLQINVPNPHISFNTNNANIILDNGSLRAKTKRGDQGNITISQADTLLLRNNSEITTDASESATGGDITINSDGIALIDNSNITAQAEDGRGGNIQITTQRLFQEPDSIIDASSEENIDGEITINSPDVDPTSGLVELPSVTIDAAAILAQDLCKFEDEKIAKGSSFIITGRGGLTPTSAEPLENLDNVVRWTNRDDLKVSKNGVVGVRQYSESNKAEKSYPVIQQAQGWVTTADGSVWLVANAPETIPQNSRIVPPDCRALQNRR